MSALWDSFFGKISIFVDFGEPLQSRGKPAVIPNGLARAKNLDYLPPGWLLSWWLGGLVAHFLETWGLAIGILTVLGELM